MIEDTNSLGPRKLSNHEARMEQLRYWQTKTVSERLAAMRDLNRRMLLMRGIVIDENNMDFTVCRVRRPKLSSTPSPVAVDIEELSLIPEPDGL